MHFFRGGRGAAIAACVITSVAREAAPSQDVYLLSILGISVYPEQPDSSLDANSSDPHSANIVSISQTGYSWRQAVPSEVAAPLLHFEVPCQPRILGHDTPTPHIRNEGGKLDEHSIVCLFECIRVPRES